MSTNLPCSTIFFAISLFPKDITQKPASDFLHNSLVVLIHSQAKNAVRVTPKHFCSIKTYIFILADVFSQAKADNGFSLFYTARRNFVPTRSLLPSIVYTIRTYFVLLCPILFADNGQFANAQYGFPLAVSCLAGFIAEKFLVLFFICNTL